jgi:1-acyl-sn-glycerol-3-phosphate acyltransferase
MSIPPEQPADAVLSYERQPVAPPRASAMRIAHDFPPLFKNRNFLLLWAGYVISALGDRIHFLVMLTLLQNLKRVPIGTQETAQLNIMMLLPFLLMGPLTGVIADRLPRRLVMIGADFVRVLIVVIARTAFLAVPTTSHWHDVVTWMPHWLPSMSYIVLMLLISELSIAVCSAFFSPARTALLPNLVHPDQLLRANSMTNAAGTIASLVGFILGAALVKWHLELAMYIDAGTFFSSGVLLLMMTRTARTAAPAVNAANRSGFFFEFIEGIKYLLRHKRALQIILLMFLFWCAGAIILSGLTGVVTRTYHKDVDWFGYFLGVVGVGMMAGAAVCSIAKRGIPKEFGIAWAMAMVGIFLYLFSLPSNWGWALAFLVVSGFFGAILLVTLDTLLQRIVPDYVRGRVMAARDMLANVGLVGVAVPLAIDPHIDDYIITVLRIVAGVVTAVGIVLMVYYYRRSTLPVGVAIMRRIAATYLSLWHRLELGNACRVPADGATIVVSNHTCSLDPLILQTACKRRLIRFMMAREYYLKKPFHYLYRILEVIPVNRSGNDTASIRTSLRTLKDGRCLGMFPEGRIGVNGRLLDGRQGVALMALSSGATVVPAYIRGGHTHDNLVHDFTKRSRITIFFGASIRFDDLAGKERDEAARDEATRRIMGAIMALRDKYETDPTRRMTEAEWEAAHPEAKKSPPAPAPN